ncbi:MAG TPA: hypothetical protein VF101_03375 [Gaiellaceae bacterium]
MAVLGSSGCGHGSSTDGWRLLVESDRDGVRAAYAVNVETGTSARMMSIEGAYTDDPIPSPDGRTLLVRTRHPYLVGVDGSHRRRIRLTWLATSQAWSPDGKQFVYTPPGNETTGIWKYDLKTGRRTRISFGEYNSSPAWSPDGKRIAYAGDDGVFVADADGRDTRRLSSMHADWPVWSPNGKTIAVVDVSSATAGIWLLPVAGGKPLRVSRGAQEAVWSPDGKWLALTVSRGRHWDLFVARGDGAHPRRLTFGPGSVDVRDPRWTPDGGRIVFVRFAARAPGELEMSEIWSIEPDGSGLREVTRAYPAGGNNYPLGWVRGKLRRQPSPKPWARPRTLNVPYPVGALSAAGRRVAVAPLVPYSGDSPLLPSGPILVWRPDSGSIAAHVTASCLYPAFVSLAGSRLAFDCDNSGEDTVSHSVRIFGPSDGTPVEVFYGGNAAHGEISSGTAIGKLAGHGSLVAFTSEAYKSMGEDVRLVAKRLWRIDGVRRRPLLSGRGLGDPVDVDGGRIALQGGRAGAAVVDRTGRRVDRLRVPELRSPRSAFLWTQRRLVLTGSRAAVLAGGRLRVYDVRSGRLVASWRLAQPTQELAGAAAGLVVFVHGRSVHVVRLRDGRTATFAVPAQRLPEANPGTRRVEADISTRGLYYSYNVRRGRYPGRVVLVPLARVLGRLR